MCQLLDFNIRLAALHKKYRFSYGDSGDKYDDKYDDDSDEKDDLEEAFQIFQTICSVLQPLPPWREKGRNIFVLFSFLLSVSIFVENIYFSFNRAFF